MWYALCVCARARVHTFQRINPKIDKRLKFTSQYWNPSAKKRENFEKIIEIKGQLH